MWTSNCKGQGFVLQSDSGKWYQSHPTLPVWSVLEPKMWQRLVNGCYRFMIPLNGIELLLGSSSPACNYILQPYFASRKKYVAGSWPMACGEKTICTPSRPGARKPPKGSSILSSPHFSTRCWHVQSDFGSPVWKHQSLSSPGPDCRTQLPTPPIRL